MNDDLFTHIDRIKINLKEHDDVPEWDTILIVEDNDIKHEEVSLIQEKSLKTPENYKLKFQELINKGYGWINIVTNGILNKTLILSVEIPKSPSGIPADKVTVNLSGPYLKKDGTLRWDVNKTVNIVK